ncbi:MAG: hypothetical protein HY400_04675 [Elusimicrobia bacterium]|nr:hypothetical protein [Elusimicrobiota bacterium]
MGRSPFGKARGDEMRFANPMQATTNSQVPTPGFRLSASTTSSSTPMDIGVPGLGRNSPKPSISTPTVSNIPVFVIKTGRDPMLSPADVQFLKAEQERGKRTEEDVVAKPVRKKPRRIQDRIRLQGIVEAATGVSVIVNNEMYQEGGRVLGARIVRIQGNQVLFEYKGRRFVKSIKVD